MGNATSSPRWRRYLLRGLIALGAIYLLLVGGLLAFEDRFVFRPNARGGQWVAPPESLPVEEVWLESAEGQDIHAWWCPQPGANGAVLFCHGNAGNLSQRSGDIQKVRDGLNASVLIFDYPGFGRSGGAPSEAGCYGAADAAYDWLTTRVPAERIVLFGQSLGGGVATDLASRRPHRALVLFKTFTSIPDVAFSQYPFLPTSWLLRNRFENLQKIDRCRQPLFIAHGDCDRLIPLTQAERLYEQAPGPKQFLLLPGCGHNGGVPRDVMAQAAAFLKDKAPCHETDAGK